MDQGLDFQIQVEASECKGRGVEPGEALSLSLSGVGKKKQTNKQTGAATMRERWPKSVYHGNRWHWSVAAEAGARRRLEPHRRGRCVRECSCDSKDSGPGRIRSRHRP